MSFFKHMKPRYEHACKECIFIGCVKVGALDCDLYFHGDVKVYVFGKSADGFFWNEELVSAALLRKEG